MKAFVNRKIVQGPWGGGARWVRAFYDHSCCHGIEIIDDPKRADAIVIAGIDQADGLPGAADLLWHPKKLFRVNECDRRKDTKGLDKTIKSLIADMEKTVFVSNWLREELSPGSSHAVIINGVDQNIFKQIDKPIHDTINIVVHHWSSHELKGGDFYRWLCGFVRDNEGFTFTYVGRTGIAMPEKLAGDPIVTKIRHIQPLWGTALGTELARYDVVVNASRFDPGPNSCVETIACGLPTYVHADGGGGREFAGDDHIFSTTEELEKILRSKKFEKNSFVPQTWECCIAKYAEVLKSM